MDFIAVKEVTSRPRVPVSLTPILQATGLDTSLLLPAPVDCQALKVSFAAEACSMPLAGYAAQYVFTACVLLQVVYNVAERAYGPQSAITQSGRMPVSFFGVAKF